MLKVVKLAALFALTTTAANAALITNGDFETTTLTQSGQFTTQVAGWTNAATTGWTGYGYNFLIMPGTADTTGFYSLNGNHDYLWGPNSGSNNGLTASPSGGNYIAADGDPNFHGAISQTVNGLTAGTQYQLTFNWAGAQFKGNTAPTTEAWNVTFGANSQTTATLQNASEGFTGWQTATMLFTAASTSQVLSFLAQGSPTSEPPTVLLDNVSLTAVPSAVPEPASLALLATSLLAVTAFTRKYARKSV